MADRGGEDAWRAAKVAAGGGGDVDQDARLGEGGERSGEDQGGGWEEDGSCGRGEEEGGGAAVCC